MTRRSESRVQWQRLADGERDDDLLAWLAQRAAAILQADDLPAGSRRDGIVRAVGLQYRQELHSRVADTVSLMLEFPIGGADGKEREAKRGERMRSMIATARAAEPGWEALTDGEIRKRLARILAR